MQIILGLFPDTAQAQAAAQALLAGHNTFKPAHIGIVSKTADGQVDFLETAEERELRRLSTLGSVTGWLLGLAGAVVGAPFTIWQGATAGDLLGADAAIRHDTGFPDEALRHLGEHLHAGSTAIVILAHHEESGPIMSTLKQLGGAPYQGALPPELEAALTGGRDDD